MADQHRRFGKLRAKQDALTRAARGCDPYGTPAQRRRWFEGLAEDQRLIRKVLGLLGHDPDTATSLVQSETKTREALAALPPLPTGPDGRPAPDDIAAESASPITEKDRQIREELERLSERYTDMATPPPDLVKESFITLCAYVRGRVIAATRI